MESSSGPAEAGRTSRFPQTPSPGPLRGEAAAPPGSSSGPAEARIRRAETDADLAVYAEVWNAITPREPTTVAFIRRRLDKQPGKRLYVVAERAGPLRREVRALRHAGCEPPVEDAQPPS
jgi:hypothetical protein